MAKYWLMKSEPEVFSIDDLKKQKSTLWEGVRNYQARNFMTQDMQEGDLVLFYHSNAEPTGIVGIAKVVSKAVPDPTQFDKKSEYFDKGATKDNPRWQCVKVGFQEKFPKVLTLNEIKTIPQLADMLVIRKGQRLSIQPVEKSHFDFITTLMRKK